MLGRDPTLTNRTEIWAATKAHPVDPIFGCGYLNFWDMVGPIKLGESAAVELKTAHNGYLEIFLDGGYLGILFLVIMLISRWEKSCAELCSGPSRGCVCHGYLLHAAAD